MKKFNMILMGALLFMTMLLPAMERSNIDTTQESKSEKLDETNNGQKHKALKDKNKRKHKKIKRECSEEEEEPIASASDLILVERFEAENSTEIEAANWDGLAEEVWFIILSFVMNTDKALFGVEAKDDKGLSEIFKEYGKLNLVSKQIRNIASDHLLFNLGLVIGSLDNLYPDYLKKILHNAAKLGCTNLLGLVLEKNPTIAKRIPELIAVASQSNHREFSQKLIDAGIFEGLSNPDLVHAIYLRDFNRVRSLIEAGQSTASLSSGATELIIATEAGDINIFKMLLIANPERLNRQVNDGNSAFNMASLNGHKEIIELVLANGIEVNKQNDKGATALHSTSITGQKEVIVLLLDRGADINMEDEKGSTALHWASGNGYEGVAEVLLSRAANINQQDKEGITALHLASFHGRKQVVELLLKGDADIKKLDNNGSTALHSAAFNGHKEITGLLLDRGADIDQQDNKHATALHCATFNDHKEVIELLLDKGTNIDAQNNDRLTALHIASLKGYKEIVELLLNRGADIARRDCTGSTALHLACLQGDKEIVELLLYRCADITITNIRGHDALAVATFKGHTEIIQLLQEYIERHRK